MKIKRLAISDFKRIKVVEIEPDGSLVQIRGRNGAGKTSVLDGIAAALGGETLAPKEPVRRGADGATVRVELDDGLVIERRWTASGGSSLRLTSREGVKLDKPQTRLDGIIGRFSFDPLAFLRLPPKEQAETLRRLSGVDFSLLDGRRARAYEERTVANRALAQVKARLAALPEVQAPDVLVSAADLHAEQAARAAVLTAHNRARLDLETLRNRHAGFKRAVADAEARIASLEEQLARERQVLDAAKRELELNREAGLALKDEVEALVDPDMNEIPAKLREIEATNERVRQKQARAALAKDLAAAEAEADRLDKEVAGIDGQKAAILAEAHLPVEGLAFSEGGVSFGGLPLEQASQSQQLRISVAIGSALNPQLRAMLVRDGSLLDADSLALLNEEAERAGLQVWLEMVSTGPGGGVVIEDGMVLDAGAEDAA